MRKINLYGAPSSGKSILAALLFAELKILGYSAEMVREFAKEEVYLGKDISNLPTNERLDILKVQIARERLFSNQVDFLVLDAPVLISTFYNDNENALKLARQFRSQFSGEESNYFLERNHAFEKNGRSHDEEQSMKIEIEMKQFLKNEGIKFHILKSSSRENLNTILKIEKIH